MYRKLVAPLLALFLFAPTAPAEEKTLADALRTLDANVFKPGSDEAKAAATTVARDVRAGLRAANRRSTEEWKALKTIDDWEKFRTAKLKALRDSLGQWPDPPTDLKVKMTGLIQGDGYRIEKLVFQSRPGLLVTANLYAPPKPGAAMPGIIIVHSHHNAKTQGELQDMGITWAKQGCLVLVPDQLGHGERRQHPFKDAASFPQKFAVSRQDYYFRYNEALQLDLVGESLIGWMAWDLMRGVDLLLARPGIDKNRIILLGSVAAGGDTAAVTAALDPRITVVAPFNFGGPQPETTYPLPADAETSINWAGSGSWESTRNLRHSAADGFLPWVIVGSVAPRGSIYGHEFSWDREHDPIYRRFETIWDFYGPNKHLAAATGRGGLSGKPPAASHCNNIGPIQRKGIYAALKQWYDMPIPEKESNVRYKSDELFCVTPEVAKEMKPLHVLAGELAQQHLVRARQTREALPINTRSDWIWSDFEKRLGLVRPKGVPKQTAHPVEKVGDVLLERIEIEGEPGIVIPILVLSPAKRAAESPVVVGLCHEGKAAFLKNNATSIAALLEAGIVVCLPDVRGTGETRAGNDRGRCSTATALSSSELMLGKTMLGLQLRDLRSVLAALVQSRGIDRSRIALWGTSFAKSNPHGKDLGMPLEFEPLPAQSEPMGALLALLGALDIDSIKVVYAQNGLVNYQSILDSPFVYVPHDAIVPGVLKAGDLSDVAASLAPRSLRIETPVDGLNRRVSAEKLASVYKPTSAIYEKLKARKRLSLVAEPKPDGAQWLIDALKTK